MSVVGTAKRLSWGMTRDQDGHRDFNLVMRVVTDTQYDGPATVMNASGLYLPGAPWIQDNDSDYWALCHPDMEIKSVVSNEPNKWWDVTQKFSTRPLKRCQDTQIGDPLSEPMKISGSFCRFSKLTTVDQAGHAILSSSLEPIPVEKDDNRPSVVIEQNTLGLELDIFSNMVDYVNDNPLWGVPEAAIKLSNVVWERKVYGSCNFYFTRRFEFEIKRFGAYLLDGPNSRFVGGFYACDIADKGFRRLRGYYHPSGDWLVDLDADKDDIDDFILIKDKFGNITQTPLLLDGEGNVVEQPNNPANQVLLPPKQIYPTANLLLLGIPSVLG